MQQSAVFILEDNEEGLQMLNNRRSAKDSVLASLREIPILAGLSNAALRRIDSLMAEITLKPGARLTTEGEHGREAFIVISGTADVLVAGKRVSTVGAGDVVGEMALLGRQPRSASVIAQTPMQVYVLNPSEFSTLLADSQVSGSITSLTEIRTRELGERSR